MNMENKLKHLEFIQSAINRMAGYSFLLKGWSVTLVVALFAFAVKEINEINCAYIIVVYLPVFIFWLLDGYFLWQERSFRVLYDRVRKKSDDQINFSMDIKGIKKFHGGKNTWMWSIFSTTLSIFYLSLLIIMLLITFLLK